jgi:dolichol-phosphate mannosyltransferase
MPPTQSTIDLSIVIPALNEAENLSTLLPEIRIILESLDIQYEIIVVDECADDSTCHVVEQYNAELLCPDTKGYGMALFNGLQHARGAFLISMDADFSHPPLFIKDLWAERHGADIVIASRYVRGGKADMPFSRFLLSRVLNLFFGLGLSIPVRDMSSGYRLYRAGVVRGMQVTCKDFDILQELLVRAVASGKVVKEIPFTYRPRKHGSSHARVFKFGMAYLRTFRRLWQVRHSTARSFT